MIKKSSFVAFLLFLCFISLFCCSESKTQTNPVDVYNDYEVDFSWKAIMGGYRFAETAEAVPMILNNKADLISYCKDNNMKQAIDDDDAFKDTEVGNILSQYDKVYFEENILIIIPSVTSSSTQIWPLEKACIKNNKIYILKKDYPKPFVTTDDELEMIYFVEMKADCFASESELEFFGIIQNKEWEKYK